MVMITKMRINKKKKNSKKKTIILKKVNILITQVILNPKERIISFIWKENI